MTADTFDEGLIRARAPRSRRRADMAVAQARIHAEVLQILTAEQQAQAEGAAGPDAETAGNRRDRTADARR